MKHFNVMSIRLGLKRHYVIQGAAIVGGVSLYLYSTMSSFICGIYIYLYQLVFFHCYLMSIAFVLFSFFDFVFKLDMILFCSILAC